MKRRKVKNGEYNPIDRTGKTPLQWAIISKRISIIRVFLDFLLDYESEIDSLLNEILDFAYINDNAFATILKDFFVSEYNYLDVESFEEEDFMLYLSVSSWNWMLISSLICCEYWRLWKNFKPITQVERVIFTKFCQIILQLMDVTLMKIFL